MSSVPDAPTSIPLTIRTSLWSTNPVAAAARPVKALRSEITTGMSAPPIGSTKRTPKSADPAMTTQSSHSSWTPATSVTPIATQAASRARFANFWPG